MHVTHINVGPHPTGCYLVSSNKHNVVIIDPGDDPEKIIKTVKSLQLTPKIILITHGHYDHIEAVNQLKETYNATVYISKDEIPLINNSQLQSLYAGHPILPVKIDRYLNENDTIILDELSFNVIKTPGHSPGSICFLIQDCLFSGDTLFSDGGIGRTDLFMGSYSDIANSIQRKLFTLPDQTVVYPGHGSSSTIGKEKHIHLAYSSF
ncbi:MAG: hypothetical protein A2Y40_02655 [Candidatus Margulisbacteria bacterium GWF2_35_9]|nr:MAG: hypothetical protein A2Y40_02655 [Candidatus Margulisbacteria bacterium GWF2_35_9]